METKATDSTAVTTDHTTLSSIDKSMSGQSHHGDNPVKLKPDQRNRSIEKDGREDPNSNHRRADNGDRIAISLDLGIREKGAESCLPILRGRSGT